MNERFPDVIQGNVPVLVDFYAGWCSPCRMMSPVLDQLKKSMGNSVRILKIDVEKNPALAAQYGIQSVPSLLVFRQGSLKWKGKGIIQADALAEIIRKASSV